MIPICYAFEGSHIYSALDRKPKNVASRRLKRVKNIIANPRVALVIDDYSEDWNALAYVLVHGVAEVVEDVKEQAYAENLLRRKYPQYAEFLEPGCTVLKITVERVNGWGRL